MDIKWAKQNGYPTLIFEHAKLWACVKRNFLLFSFIPFFFSLLFLTFVFFLFFISFCFVFRRPLKHPRLTLSWRRPLSYRNQFIDLQSKSMDWFLYDNGLSHERVNSNLIFCSIKSFFTGLIKSFSKANVLFACRLTWKVVWAQTFPNFDKLPPAHGT